MIDGSKDKEKTEGYLAPHIILEAVATDSDRLDKVIEEGEMQLSTSLFSVFEALACIEDNDEVDFDAFLNMVKNTEIQRFEGMKENFDITELRKTKIKEKAKRER